ncbi:hypothetical protein VB620_17230 [Nodularia harveyana UHCC-0300]|uniref:Uncharacterized protein n=1 Tax=Nodularia harveyana UHCC-0300 TaxID=2974287 RepID=A0ABU5UHP0_9CYAN|nr:hypothetical protein [Nodularia harveyana]MEA5583077.1 hypothetical protein [Nodularia harveyana UHCC-0300]
MDKKLENQINQPVNPDLDYTEQPTVNPGDVIDESKSLKQKAQQLAVNTQDITGDQITVPTYFIVENPDGTKKAAHHVRDAEEISDVIRQARVDEDGNRTWW